MATPLPKIKGYFAFTNPLPYRKDLAEWEAHFAAQGIKTQILEYRDAFILYREGEEAGKDNGNRTRIY